MPDGIKLKPCPFCGGEPLYLGGYILRLDEDGNEVDEYDTENARIWFGACVLCPECDYDIEKKRISSENNPEGWQDQVKRDAVDAWNRRANDV